MEIISYRPDDDQFWIGCTKDEAERYFLPLLDDKGKEYYEFVVHQERSEEYVKMVCNAMGINSLSYAYFNVSRDLKECYCSVPHHPFHQLWNAYSPFRACKHVTILSLEELRDIKIELITTDI